MLGICFFVLCFVSVLFTVVAGDPAALSNGVLDGAGRAMELMFSLSGAMALWCGIMNVLQEAGWIGRLSRLLSPILGRVFPSSWEDSDTREKITAAVSANILGIGNAATPLALSAMEAMQRRNPTPHRSTDDMITLAVVATASFDLLPTTLIALRRSGGSSAPYAILPPVWITSFVCCTAAILLCRGAGWAWRDRREN